MRTQWTSAEKRRLVLVAEGVLITLRSAATDLNSLVRSLAPATPEPVDSESGAEVAARDHQSPVPLVTLHTVSEAGPTFQKKYDAEQARTYELQRRGFWVQLVLCVFTAGAFGAAAYYADIARQQLEAMNKAFREVQNQTTLLRQQLVGTQAATVTLTLTLYPNSMLTVDFDQRGIVAAKNVCLTFHAVRKTIPDLTNIGSPVPGRACEPVLSDKVFRAPQEFGLPGLTPAVMEAIRRTEQTVMVTGEFSYDNGFGDIAREDVCQYWLSGIPDKAEPDRLINAFVPCGEFPVRLNNVLKTRREIEAGNH